MDCGDSLSSSPHRPLPFGSQPVRNSDLAALEENAQLRRRARRLQDARHGGRASRAATGRPASRAGLVFGASWIDILESPSVNRLRSRAATIA